MMISRLVMPKVALLILILPALDGAFVRASDPATLVEVVVTKEVTKSKNETGSKTTNDERIDVVEVVSIRNRASRPLLKLDVTVVAEVVYDGDGMKRDRYKGLNEHFIIERLEIGKEEVRHCKPIQLQKFSGQSTAKKSITAGNPGGTGGGTVGFKSQSKVRKVTVTVMEAGKQIWVTK